MAKKKPYTVYYDVSGAKNPEPVQTEPRNIYHESDNETVGGAFLVLLQVFILGLCAVALLAIVLIYGTH